MEAGFGGSLPANRRFLMRVTRKGWRSEGSCCRKHLHSHTTLVRLRQVNGVSSSTGEAGGWSRGYHRNFGQVRVDAAPGLTGWPTLYGQTAVHGPHP